MSLWKATHLANWLEAKWYQIRFYLGRLGPPAALTDNKYANLLTLLISVEGNFSAKCHNSFNPLQF